MRSIRYVVLALPALIGGCGRAPDAPEDNVVVAETASASVSASSSAASVVYPAQPQILEPEELRYAAVAELTDDGWIGLVKKDGSDEAKSAPLSLVTSTRGAAISREEVPFSSAGDLKGGLRLVAHDLRARRFVVAARDEVRLWEGGTLGEPTKGTFPLLGGVAISKDQAIAITGRMDKRGFVDQANGTKAFRNKGGVWTRIELPGPAEKDWASCFWDATAKQNGGELLLLQICAAPRREMAYAVYKLASDAETPERIPFDNAVFDAARAMRGSFQIEDDGTIDLGSGVGGMNEGEMTLARLRGGEQPWVVTKVRMPTRLASTVGTFGDRLLFTDGGPRVRESRDGGKTFEEMPPLTKRTGMLLGCNATGCAFQSFGDPGGATPWLFRRWSR